MTAAEVLCERADASESSREAAELLALAGLVEACHAANAHYLICVVCDNPMGHHDDCRLAAVERAFNEEGNVRDE
jgi:hypothetical protein